METEKVLSSLNNILQKPYTAQVYFVLQKNKKFEIKLADIENKTEPDIREMFTNTIKESILDNSDFRVLNLSLADENQNAIYLYDYKSYPDELGIFKDFKIDNPIKYDIFNFKSDNLTQLFGYIIYLGSMEDGIVLFKKHYPISLIKRNSFLLGIKKDNERFSKISSSDIIRLNGTAQLMKIDDKIYILDVKTLERNMGFKELIGKAAAESIEKIQSLGLLEDIEVLKDTLDDFSFIRKLSKINNYSPIFKLKINTQTIIQFTKITPALKGKFKYSEDGSKIRLDTKKSKNEFLLLMNDAYLTSELTKQYYEASAKDNISK